MGKVKKEEERVAEDRGDTSRKKRKSVLWLILFIIVTVGLLGAGYGYYYYQQNQEQAKNSPLGARQEAERIVKEVASLMELPSDETPTIATVTDVSKLQGQAFFAKAKNGDKVLLYQQAKKAILYDPQIKRIIEVGPFNVQEQASASATTPQTEPVTVAIYNGTKVVGLAGSVEKDLREQAKNIQVVRKGNTRGNYTKTLIIDQTGKHKEAAKQLATLLKGEIGSLPKDETQLASSATAAILIILGR